MKAEFPMEIKDGSIAVKIYKRENKGYEEFTLSYYQDGKRKMETSADLLALRARADEVLEDLAEGVTAQQPLKSGQRDDYLKALKILEPTGQSLITAVRHYAESFKIAGTDVVIPATQEYKRRHMDKVQSRLVSEVVKEMLDEKIRANKSTRHIETLRSHCGKFGAAMAMNLASVSADDINLFLDTLKKKNKQGVSARTRDNFADSIVTLFEWAKVKRYVPDDYDETARIVRLSNDEDGEITTYTPKEIEALLTNADAKVIPFLALGAFAGLRSSEILRLKWEDVRLENCEPCIIVQQGKVKKRGKSRRIVPMTDNLKAWLSPVAKKKGPVFKYGRTYIYELLEDLAPKAKVEWKSNALRHSYISYRVMKTKNLPQVALECGNSPQMIDSNYRELVSEADAKLWFEISPKT
jgi:integrase